MTKEDRNAIVVAILYPSCYEGGYSSERDARENALDRAWRVCYAINDGIERDREPCPHPTAAELGL